MSTSDAITRQKLSDWSTEESVPLSQKDCVNVWLNRGGQSLLQDFVKKWLHTTDQPRPKMLELVEMTPVLILQMLCHVFLCDISRQSMLGYTLVCLVIGAFQGTIKGPRKALPAYCTYLTLDIGTS